MSMADAARVILLVIAVFPWCSSTSRTQMRIPVMMCTPPAMIPSRRGFTFGHMGGIISVSPPAAVLMPAMDLYLARSFILGVCQLVFAVPLLPARMP
jgi:hypothetical protein